MHCLNIHSTFTSSISSGLESTGLAAVVKLALRILGFGQNQRPQRQCPSLPSEIWGMIADYNRTDSLMNRWGLGSFT